MNQDRPADWSAGLSLDKTADYFAQEYLQLESIVENFDGRALTIKAWSVTFSAAGLGLAYQQHNRFLLLIAAGSAMVFWIVEAVWKTYQRAFHARIMEIERWFSNLTPDARGAPFQIINTWHHGAGTGWSRNVLTAANPAVRRPWSVMFYSGVMLPHVVVFVAGILLFAFASPSVI